MASGPHHRPSRTWATSLAPKRRKEMDRRHHQWLGTTLGLSENESPRRDGLRLLAAPVHPRNGHGQAPVRYGRARRNTPPVHRPTTAAGSGSSFFACVTEKIFALRGLLRAGWRTKLIASPGEPSLAHRTLPRLVAVLALGARSSNVLHRNHSACESPDCPLSQYVIKWGFTAISESTSCLRRI